MKAKRIIPMFVAAAILLTSGLLFFNTKNSGSETTFEPKSGVNAVIGDVSYYETFGELPDASVPDIIRIRTHLEFVESKLRNNPPEGLTEAELERRNAYLDHLLNYIRDEAFPVNDDHPDKRRPTFISENGNICAVGYLVRQTAGAALTEEISRLYKYSFIPEINDPRFLAWADDSGFTVEELAMIQPTYPGPPPQQENQVIVNNHLGVTYSVATGSLLSANLVYWSLDLTNSGMFRNEANNHWVGMAIGAGTLLFGSLHLDNTDTYLKVSESTHNINPNVYQISERNVLKTSFSVGHMVVGAATMARSAYHLFFAPDRSASPSDSGVILSGIPTDPQSGMGTVQSVGYRIIF